MYTGQLALEALEGHSCGLLLAAYKYDIPLLVEICEIYLINTLSVEKVLDALQITSLVNCANALKEAAMNMIVQNSDSLLFSREYEEFALNNPLLAVRISQSIMQQRQHCQKSS
jgi:speckle-type POZ protein